MSRLVAGRSDGPPLLVQIPVDDRLKPLFDSINGLVAELTFRTRDIRLRTRDVTGSEWIVYGRGGSNLGVPSRNRVANHGEELVERRRRVTGDVVGSVGALRWRARRKEVRLDGI